MDDNLSFCFSMATVTAAAIRVFYSMLKDVPKDILIFLLLFSCATLLIARIFRYRTKGRAPYNLWFIRVPPWCVPTVISVIFSALLFLDPSC